MSVQQMSFITLIGPIEEFDGITKRAFKQFDFHPEHATTVLKDVKGLYSFSSPNPYDSLLKKVTDALALCRIAPRYAGAQEMPLSLTEIEDLCDTLSFDISANLKQKAALEESLTDNERIILQLKPLEGLSVSIDDLFNFEYLKFRFGKIPRDGYEKFKLYLEESKTAFYIPAFEEEGYIWGLYFVPRQYAENIDSLFASLHFERQRLSNKAHGTPKVAMLSLLNQNEGLTEQLHLLTMQLTELVSKYKEKLLISYSQIKYEHDIYEIRNYSAHSQKNFYLTGWLAVNQTDDFSSQFDDDPLISCLCEKPNEMDANITPPTKLKNFFMFKPFEEFVTMYGLPSYGEVDPTPLLAITYILLFGIMFGDVGQGFLLILVGFFMAIKLKMNLGKILSYCGVSSMLFGCFYGSVFGYETLLPWEGFKALHNSSTINLTIGASIVIGVLLISVAMVINIYNGIKQKDMEKIFFHFNGIAGFVFYWGVIFAILGMFGFGANLVSPLYVLCVIVLPLLLIYLKEPLGKLLSKRQDWKPENPGEYLMESVFELFEVVLSYITNTVSFMRVGAFALNHAGMMLAVFILSRMFGGSENLVIIILGNIFVMCMEGLIVGIQVLRLEFYELFSRFFTGEGKAFAPFKINYEKK